MDTPNILQSAVADETLRTTRRDDEDGGTLTVVDFGERVTAHLDVVGDTAIVVADDRQFEFDISEGMTDLSVNGGMLRIRA